MTGCVGKDCPQVAPQIRTDQSAPSPKLRERSTPREKHPGCSENGRLYPEGPYFVTNHFGDEVEAELFGGVIEHARGLASERYLTNPMSSSDRDLMQDYIRSEFQGRPLDGTFVLRVWDEPGVQFTQIEHLQLVLNYGYWTRNR